MKKTNRPYAKGAEAAFKNIEILPSSAVGGHGRLRQNCARTRHDAGFIRFFFEKIFILKKTKYYHLRKWRTWYGADMLKDKWKYWTPPRSGLVMRAGDTL
jgi:hypothetical protein